jgi:hypothetical protein
VSSAGKYPVDKSKPCEFARVHSQNNGDSQQVLFININLDYVRIFVTPQTR